MYDTDKVKEVIRLFSTILKQLRQSRDLTQEQLGEAVYVSTASISHYENGRSMPSRETLENLSKFFGVSTDYLMGSSTLAEFEELMNQEYCDGVKVSAFVDKCMSVTGKDREALLTVVDALEMRNNQKK